MSARRTIDPMRSGPQIPTDPEPVSHTEIRRARAGRRLGLAVLGIVVVLAATQRFGVRTATVTGGDGGSIVEVRYPAVTRPGLAVEWSLNVRSDGGFAGPVRIELPVDYLAMFDLNAVHPEPASMAASGDTVTWVFEPPPGTSTEVIIDASTEAGRQWGAEGSAVVAIGDRTIARVPFTTVVMP